jgi:DNA-binding NarL/FixJ family response regulator
MRPVLIVEDNPVFRTVLKGILTTRIPTIVVEEASTGEEALTQFRKTDPFLIFMDIRLPDGSGLEITRTIKEINPEIQIIILTSHDMPEYREVAFLNGASHFLTKGNLKIDDVISLVASALKSKDKKYRIEHLIN